MNYRLLLSTLVEGENPYNWSFFNRFLTSPNIQRLSLCRLCGSRDLRTEICTPCHTDLPWRQRPWQKRLAHVDQVVACFNFTYPIRQLVHRAKYGRDIACARFLGELAAQRLLQLNKVSPKAVIFPVPLARRRMLVRGFNQAVEISLPIMRLFSLAMDEVSVYRPRPGAAQSGLDAKTRRKNIRGAFMHKGLLAAETVIIVDDVITTGATVSAMAKTLKAAGAKTVLVWVVAAA